ncbi:MAG: TadE/TadG family type IV pilus assembly protein [Desulfovibrionaceae bacterium]|nr:pilus assembly protein [Desulfovibrionaceae bacterium]MDD4953051.1 TadE/TadG family type IV pilus assembly protein [Desulfovibrionaceae bacterium]
MFFELKSRLAGLFGRQGTRGISVVEFALILPVFLTLVMGVIETGNMFRTWLTVQKAAQSAARFATTGQGDEEGTRLSQIVQKAQEVVATLPQETEVLVRSWPGMDTAAEPTDNDPGGPCQVVEVRVRADYEPITPLLGPLLPEVIPLVGADRKVNEPWYPCG